MVALEEFCTINAGLRPRMLGRTPSGVRLDFAFEGSAEGPHWEGSRPVSGVDYATVRSDGNLNLDIRGVIGEGRRDRFVSGDGGERHEVQDRGYAP